MELQQFVRPSSSRPGVLREVMVGGRREFEWEMTTDKPAGSMFTRFDNGAFPSAATLRNLGLAQRQVQEGTP